MTLIDRRWIVMTLLLAAMVLAQVGYAVAPGAVVALRPWASATVVARNVCLALWALAIASGER